MRQVVDRFLEKRVGEVGFGEKEKVESS